LIGIGGDIWVRIVWRVESWGVVPPEEYEVHSSRRDAPDDAAVRAEGSVKTAISSIVLIADVRMEEMRRIMGMWEVRRRGGTRLVWC
jgi:hypothetical protein